MPKRATQHPRGLEFSHRAVSARCAPCFSTAGCVSWALPRCHSGQTCISARRREDDSGAHLRIQMEIRNVTVRRCDRCRSDVLRGVRECESGLGACAPCRPVQRRNTCPTARWAGARQTLADL